MELKDLCMTGEKLDLRGMPTDAKPLGYDKKDKAKLLGKTEENLAAIAALQDKLYAEGKEGIVIVLQAMDAAGKDSIVKHVMTCLNPQGVNVTSFKQPSKEELSHDFLWRAWRALPGRGEMAIFNRSYYEDVLVVKVHQLQKGYKMADRVLDDAHFFDKRYTQIKNFEEYLYDNSYRVLKIFLNVSKAEQKKRFLERIDDQSKNWKFSAADLTERGLWDEYQKAFEEAITATGSKHSPWYVIPADQKWFTRYLVSTLVRETLEACHPAYPVLPDSDQQHLDACKQQLLAEDAPADKADKADTAE